MVSMRKADEFALFPHFLRYAAALPTRFRQWCWRTDAFFAAGWQRLPRM